MAKHYQFSHVSAQYAQPKFLKLGGVSAAGDYTAYCAVNDAFEFRQGLGDRAIMAYIRKLALDGGKLLTDMWGTFTLVPPSMQPAMTNPVRFYLAPN